MTITPPGYGTGASSAWAQAITEAINGLIDSTGTAKPWNSAWGEVAYAAATSDQGSITTATDLTGLSVTFTAVSGRKYKVTGSTWFYSSVDGDAARLLITDGSNTVLQQANRSKVGTAANVGDATMASVRRTGLSGSTTVKLRAQRAAGTGNITASASSTSPAFIMVEDIGPA